MRTAFSPLTAPETRNPEHLGRVVDVDVTRTFCAFRDPRGCCRSSKLSAGAGVDALGDHPHRCSSGARNPFLWPALTSRSRIRQVGTYTWSSPSRWRCKSVMPSISSTKPCHPLSPNERWPCATLELELRAARGPRAGHDAPAEQRRENRATHLALHGVHVRARSQSAR